MIKNNIRIVAYTRISVDDDLDNENISIENQKAIIKEFVDTKFPDIPVTFFEDRDMSGYTFEQRTGYQKMKKLLLNKTFNVLIVKDFSRFSRRNSLGLLELENLRDNGVRVISIGDSIDYPTNNDWLMIQFKFLMNEIPVTETSNKIKAVVRKRQKDGEWICNAPYGYYLHPTKKNTICVDEEGAEIVKEIFNLYLKGWGYKKIANYLTEKKAPTGLQLMEKQIKAKDGDSSKIEKKINPIWSISSVAKIIKNDFYIGTLRQNVWTRGGINKKDVRVPLKDNLIFLNHHEAIIDQETFDKAQEQLSHRTLNHYKGIRKYPITYSGHLFCEDCGSPMFSISQPKRPAAYVCGLYHKRGLKGCTSHHIREATLDASVKSYILSARDSLKNALININQEKNIDTIEKNKTSIHYYNNKINDIKTQLKEATRQRIKQITLHPENEAIISETFDSLENEYRTEIIQLEEKIRFLKNESAKKAELRGNINKVLATFDMILKKPKFTKEDITLIINRITVDSNRIITIELKSTINEIFDIISDNY